MPHDEPTEQPPAEHRKFYVTTPIYYVNARPHIGHAYTTVVADVFARRHRLLGNQTFFLTGTDEHGQKIERSAAAAGIPPQQFADGVSAQFRALWDRMGLTYDRYIRTTFAPHKTGAQFLFAELFRLGHIYLSAYTGSYCVSDEAFVDLPPGTPCPDCGRPLETVTEENFFFRLSAFQRPLLDLIESDTLRITPEGSRNEVLSFLRGDIQSLIRDSDAPKPLDTKIEWTSARTMYLPGALKDLSVSRSSFTWGIPVPEDIRLAAGAKEPHVIYVWLDALANYMTAIGYGNPDPAAQAEFRKWWPADLHLVGKEITRFHCVYWPAFLLALNPATAEACHPERSEAESKDLRFPTHATTPPQGAPPMPQSSMGGNVNHQTTTAWATPQAEWSPEEHGLPPESAPTAATPVILSDAHSAESKDPRISPAAPQTPTPIDHAAWAAAWLPKQITANGWLLFDNSKMSKSKGNVVRTETILDAFGQHVYAKQFPNSSKQDQDLFAADVLRYYLLREIPFGQDGSFSFEALVTRYNAELVNDYGNLVSRVLSLIHQALAGIIPAPSERKLGVMQVLVKKPTLFHVGTPKDFGPFIRVADSELGRAAAALSLFYNWDFAQLRFSVGLDASITRTAMKQDAMSVADAQSRPAVKGEDFGCIDRTLLLIRATNDYLSIHKPWMLAKQDDDESLSALKDVLYEAAEAIRVITALLYPFLPYATARVWMQLGLGDITKSLEAGDLNISLHPPTSEDELPLYTWGGLKPKTRLGLLSPIFPRADKSLAQVMTDMENQNIPKDLTAVNEQHDSTHPDRSPFPEAPISSAAADTPIFPSVLTDELAGTTATTRTSSFDPAAGPRTLSPEDPGTTVAGSHAPAPERPATPHHTEAPGSGIFAGGPIPVAPSRTAAPDQHAPDRSPEITIDDFAKIDLRVAEVLLCERIPKADKLLRLEVDLGPELGRRQILSGIAEHYPPESLVGRRIVVITNLAPRKMRGLVSHGMLLAATDPSTGKPILATVSEATPPGSRLK